MFERDFETVQNLTNSGIFPTDDKLFKIINFLEIFLESE